MSRFPAGGGGSRPGNFLVQPEKNAERVDLVLSQESGLSYVVFREKIRGAVVTVEHLKPGRIEGRPSIPFKTKGKDRLFFIQKSFRIEGEDIFPEKAFRKKQSRSVKNPFLRSCPPAVEAAPGRSLFYVFALPEPGDPEKASGF